MKIINPMETLLISRFLCPDCKPVFDALLDGTEPEFIPCVECAKKIKSYEDFRDHAVQQYKSNKEDRKHDTSK